ncbi:chromate transporter [Paenibacillus xerothermodurans]|uniref:Chromate transporter n=1 Tax=Paenibacillus xerothermodurans TaxID=1977292 RepID=A0A2W1N8T9_PAEXE|nr:chromate transporter [Paenibacillus xerothermodurans]PZE20334.1 chromate transporter [Paenibacillus xerothermodurans]
MLLALFWTFLKVGLISFGGGYAILGVVEHEVIAQQWMTPHEYAHAVALAGMSPGPIATNIAVLIGYYTSGIAGAAAAIAGMILPSILVTVVLAFVLYRARSQRWLEVVLHGLKPMVCALILYAAVRVAANGQPMPGLNAHTVASVAIFIFAVVASVKYRLHPMAVLAVSGLMGIAFYT